MKHRPNAVMTLCGALTLLLAGCQDQAPKMLRLMTWNIEYGGAYTDFNEVVKTIELVQPDVLCLSEGYGSVEALAGRLGWPYADTGMQIISKFPLIEPQDAEGTYLWVELSPGRGIALSNIHLDSDPYGPTLLVEGQSPDAVLTMERETHLRQIATHDPHWTGLIQAGVPLFLTGDFNVPSHLDWTPATVGLRPHVKQVVPWPLSVHLAALGFRDSYREAHPDPVTRPGLTWFAHRPSYPNHWNPEATDPQDRIDYIMAAGPSKTLESALWGEEGEALVDRGKPGIWTSDHRAVVSRFEVVPATLPRFVALSQRVVTQGQAQPLRWRLDGGPVPFEVLPADGGAPLLQGSAPTAEGQATLDTSTLPPGDFVVRVGSGSSRLTSRPFEVLPPGARPELTLGKKSYRQGEDITVAYAHGPARRWDWLGLYPAAASMPADWESYQAFVYADHGSATGALVPRTRGTVSLPSADLKPGTYRIVFFTDEATVLAASPTFTLR